VIHKEGLVLERIGRKIKELRKEKGFTLRYVGEKLNIDYSYLSKVEKGQPLSLELLGRISEFYHVDISYFFVEIPEELKEVGVEWIELSKEAKEKNITPENIKEIIQISPEKIKQILELVKGIKE
jgi:transcriptional regulator with XRE-family HTH domain